MPPSRNAPCPCGSGKKYKRCCQPADLAAEAAAGSSGPPGPESLYADPGKARRLRRSAREDRTWEVAAVPLPSSIETEPEARPVAILVATRDAVVSMDLLLNLSGETEAVAEAMLSQLRVAMELAEAKPRRVEVAHAEVADALFPLLEEEDIEVRETGFFERAYDPARSLVNDMSGVDLWPPMSAPATWAAWGLPEEDVERLFRAAASFYRAEPWRDLSDGDALGFDFAHDVRWAGAVMGRGGESFGLALYEVPDDLLRLYGEEDPYQALEAMEGSSLTLLFESASELPRPMRREVARRGWEVAAPSAYPVLSVMNTPGGGVSREGIRRVTEALTLVPGFVEARRRRGGERLALEAWSDPESGSAVHSLFVAGPPVALGPLRSGSPRGPGANPGATLLFPVDVEIALGEPDDPEGWDARLSELFYVLRFGMALAREGLGDATVAAHMKNVDMFIRFLVFWEGVPVAAVHERDLRGFLYDWHPRLHDGALTRARRMPVSLTRFFRYLEEEEGIRCPWAEEILAERDYIRERLESCPGRHEDDPRVDDWRVEALEELDALCLRPDLGGFLELGLSWEDPETYDLLQELHREWLVWRDELIESGVDDAQEVWDRLAERQRAWAAEKGLVGSGDPAA